MAALAALVPTALVAVTVNVYGCPLVSPWTTHPVTLAAVEQVLPPGDASTVYPVTAEPPSLTGGLQLTVASPSPRTAVGTLGGAGGSGSVRTFTSSTSTPAVSPGGVTLSRDANTMPPAASTIRFVGTSPWSRSATCRLKGYVELRIPPAPRLASGVPLLVSRATVVRVSPSWRKTARSPCIAAPTIGSLLELISTARPSPE